MTNVLTPVLQSGFPGASDEISAAGNDGVIRKRS